MEDGITMASTVVLLEITCCCHDLGIIYASSIPPNLELESGPRKREGQSSHHPKQGPTCGVVEARVFWQPCLLELLDVPHQVRRRQQSSQGGQAHAVECILGGGHRALPFNGLAVFGHDASGANRISQMGLCINKSQFFASSSGSSSYL